VKPIWLVIGSDYERESVLQAFTTEGAALECLAACRTHERRRPSYPSVVEDTPENNAAAFDKADAALQRWHKRHPGGAEASSCNTFVIRPLAVRTGHSRAMRRADPA
jgi:hypothetical protein